MSTALKPLVQKYRSVKEFEIHKSLQKAASEDS